MAWSTRQLAELAGTSLRAVRHYHDIGLLPEPERAVNGYKRYGASHLVALLRIKRLSDLGFSLPQVAELEDPERTGRVLRDLDARLAADIDRLQRTRLELAVLLELPSSAADLPPAIASLADQPLDDADRAYLAVLSRVVSTVVLEAYVDMARAAYADPVFEAFKVLEHDADEQTRADVAARLRPSVEAMRRARPELDDLTRGSEVGADEAAAAIAAVTAEFYNPAQQDVLGRLGAVGRTEAGPLVGRRSPHG